jgi:hypothetical protein
MLASLFSARVFRIRCDRSVKVSRKVAFGVGLGGVRSSFRALEARMKEYSLRGRYFVGVVLMDLETVSCSNCRSW